MKTPLQYNFLGQIIKLFLHTKLGAYLGYIAGIHGFNRLEMQIIRNNGFVEPVSASFNSRVDAGAALVAALLTNNSFSITSPSYPKYLALSTSSLTPAKGDTTLSGETAVSGLTRTAGTFQGYNAPSSLDAGASYQLTNTFTAAGSATIVSAAIFDAASTGNMLVEANLATSAVLLSGDKLTVTWTINI